MPSSDEMRISRLKEIELRDFRGWVKTHTLTLEAHVVLVTSANGRGKSSLIEALGRVLNGQGFHRDGENVSLGRTGWAIRLRWDGSEIHESWPEDGTRGRWQRRVDPREYDVPEPEVLRRATTFLQDRLDRQFEAVDERSNVLAFLSPLPKWLEDYIGRLEEITSRWRGAKPEPRPDEVEMAARELEKADAQAFPMLLRATGASMAAASSGGLRALAGAILERDLSDADPENWVPELKIWVERQTSRSSAHLERRGTNLFQRFDEAKACLGEHERSWPGLWRLLGWSSGVVDLERILDLVTGLVDRRSEWADTSSLEELLAALPEASQRQVPRPDEVLRVLPLELARVDRTRASRYQRSVAEWNTFWNAREAEREKLERTVADIEEEVRRYGKDLLQTDLTAALDEYIKRHRELRSARKRYERLEEERRSWELDGPRISMLETHLAAIRDLQLERVNVDARRCLEAAMNAVMKHFVVAGIGAGESTVKLHEDREAGPQLPGISDGRTLDLHASTGQKAQLALAWLLGTNALIQRWLPHRVLLLDDVSTALDLTNLAAECALLRKFAYTENEDRRRQVVIASHHDQLTHRLFDLLLPPEGYTMLEIRLIDWEPDEGPTVKISTIRPTKAATNASRAELGKSLSDSFCGRRGSVQGS